MHFNYSQFFLFLLFSSTPFPPVVASVAPSASLALSASQQDSDILLTWRKIPLVNRRGFLLGYNVYISNGYQLTLLGKVHDGATTVQLLKCNAFKGQRPQIIQLLQSSSKYLLNNIFLLLFSAYCAPLLPFFFTLRTANLSDAEATSYTVKGLTKGTYKFTVMAYTAAGEGTGTTASITLEPYSE